MHNDNVFRLGESFFYPGSRSLVSGKGVVTLTQMEAAFLVTLLSRDDASVTRDEISRLLHQKVLSTSSRAVDVLASSVRAKLRAADVRGTIVSVRCYGYRYLGAAHQSGSFDAGCHEQVFEAGAGM
jgi:DNA-binding response OmpR family regulator